MKKRIAKADYDKLSPELQKLYKTDGADDKFILDLEDDDDASAALRARDAEKRNAADAKAKAEAAEARRTELEAELAALNEASNKTTTEKTELEKKVAGFDKQQKQLEKLQKQIEEGNKYNRDVRTKELVDGTASKMADALAGKNAALILPHIRARMEVNFKDDAGRDAELIVKDATGKPTTLENLQKELATDKTFAAIVVGSRAHGGSAPPAPGYTPGGGSAPNGGQPNPANGQQPVSFNAMSNEALKAHVAGVVAAKQAG